MAHNREALAQRALMELRLIGEGQAPSARETAEALAAISPLLERLRWLEVYRAPNPFAFADGVIHPLARLLAEDLAPSLAGRERDEFVVERCHDQLRRMQRRPLIRNELTLEAALRGTGQIRPWR